MSTAPALFGEAGSLERLSPLVRRLVAPNPGPMTSEGTNTYVVGHQTVAVIDPGPAMPEHVDRLLAALRGEQVEAIMVTHTHNDHSPGARLLQKRTGAPIVGCAPFTPARPPHPDEEARLAASNDFAHRPDQLLHDGDAICCGDVTLRALATPGHTMNHLSFALDTEKALFSGDHVMAWSTTVIAPPVGALQPFMASLKRLLERDDAVYWPGHGGPVRDPQRFVRALIHHRRQRETGIRERIAAGDTTIPAIVDKTYEDLDQRLRGAAAMSVLAHLEDLCARGLVIADPPGLHGHYTPA